MAGCLLYACYRLMVALTVLEVIQRRLRALLCELVKQLLHRRSTGAVDQHRQSIARGALLSRADATVTLRWKLVTGRCCMRCCILLEMHLATLRATPRPSSITAAETERNAHSTLNLGGMPLLFLAMPTVPGV